MKRLLAGLGFALSVATMLPGAEADDLLHAAAQAEAGQESARALEYLQQADRLRPNDARILQKIARQYSDLVVDQPDDETKRLYAQTALDYSQRAVDLDPQNAVNVLSLAVCHGKLALYSETRTKVRYSRLIREEAERALALDPEYAWAHHVLGRWHCEVASLGGTSRFFAGLLYGGLPDASLAEGIRQLLQATQLEPAELNHFLELGCAYAAAGQEALARANLEHGLAMPSRGKHDEPAKQRAREALARLR